MCKNCYIVYVIIVVCLGCFFLGVVVYFLLEGFFGMNFLNLWFVMWFFMMFLVIFVVGSIIEMNCSDVFNVVFWFFGIYFVLIGVFWIVILFDYGYKNFVFFNGFIDIFYVLCYYVIIEVFFYNFSVVDFVCVFVVLVVVFMVMVCFFGIV